jgi:hypothetical protein
VRFRKKLRRVATAALVRLSAAAIEIERRPEACSSTRRRSSSADQGRCAFGFTACLLLEGEGAEQQPHAGKYLKSKTDTHGGALRDLMPADGRMFALCALGRGARRLICIGVLH